MLTEPISRGASAGCLKMRDNASTVNLESIYISKCTFLSGVRREKSADCV